jgi:hypothetical protein
MWDSCPGPFAGPMEIVGVRVERSSPFSFAFLVPGRSHAHIYMRASCAVSSLLFYPRLSRVLSSCLVVSRCLSCLPINPFDTLAHHTNSGKNGNTYVNSGGMYDIRRDLRGCWDVWPCRRNEVIVAIHRLISVLSFLIIAPNPSFETEDIAQVCRYVIPLPLARSVTYLAPPMVTDAEGVRVRVREKDIIRL